MKRLPDWPARLAAVLREAERRPFDDARWNCGRFVLACVEAMTGQRPSWRAAPTLEAMAASAGFPPIAPALARPGDAVMAPDPDRLGIVVTAGRAVFVGPRGLLHIPAASCAAAWRIG